MKQIALQTTIIAIAIALAGGQACAVTEEEFAELKSDMNEMMRRLEALETENRGLREQEQQRIEQQASPNARRQLSQGASAGSSWVDYVRIEGDFRYRYEEIEAEGSDVRNRNRIRARAALTARLPQNAEVVLGVASGGDEPTSSTQTLGGAGTSKELRLDLAYIQWRATDQLQLTAGKMRNSFYRPASAGLIWDGDYNPEGVGITWAGDTLFFNVGANWLESDSIRENQRFVWGGQGGIRLALGEISLTTGLSYYDIPTGGEPVYFGGDDQFFGNSFDCANPLDPRSCRYRYDYQEVEWFAQLSGSLWGLPAIAYTDVVNNQDADQYDTGWLVGATLGSVDTRGQWKLGYQYEDLEADAVLGLLSDSDFAGGGTDGKGHRLTLAYALSRQWNVGLTWLFHNEAGQNTFGRAVEYDRLQLDTNFAF